MPSVNAFFVQCKNVECSVKDKVQIFLIMPSLVSCIVCPADEKSILINSVSHFQMERHVAFPITHTHKLLLFSKFSINDSIIKCSWNVDQPDMGATSIRALIVSDFPLNLSTTATNYLQFGFSLLKRSDSKVNDGERGKPAAAASKSLTTSLRSSNLLA